VLLQRCLQKEPKQRLQAIGDARISLDEVLSGAAESSSSTAAPVAAIFGRQMLMVGLGVLLLGAAIAGLATWKLKPAAKSLPTPVSRFTITPPPGQELAVLNGSAPHAVALSPDGTRIVYVGIQSGSQQLFLRKMDSLETRAIPGTEEAFAPFFSPDSQWVAFITENGKLKKVSLDGGTAVTLCDVDYRQTAGGSWGSQGNIVIGNSAGPLQEVSDAGGIPQPLTHLEKGESGQVAPEFLPGGNALFFATGTTPANFANSQIAVLSIGTGERRNLVRGADPRYAPTGHIVYLQGGTLMAVPFDPERLAVTGAAVPVLEGVRQTVGTNDITVGGDYSLSATGSLIFVPAAVQSAPLRLVWVSRDGAEQQLPADAHAYVQPRLSPDGRRMAVGITEKENQVWLYDLSRETLTRFTFQGNNNLAPFWTPDGKRIVFTSNKEGQRNLFWQLADGSGGLERLATSQYLEVPGSWSPDGQLLAFSEVNDHTGYDIWVLRLSDRKAQPFLRTSFNENAP
jgi:serine/threonine-protein kinase